MKIALAQLNYHIGNFEDNLARMTEYIRKAEDAKADIVVFSELSICGYPPDDMLNFSSFVEESDKAIAYLTSLSHHIAIVAGAPEPNPDRRGKPFFNTAYFLYQGKIAGKARKSLLPDYDVFNEYRYFEPATTFETISFKGRSIALTVCEDLWNIGHEGLYHHCPMDTLAKQGAELIINIAASPFDYTQAAKRLNILKDNVRKYNLPLVYVNQTGAQTSLIFDGGSLVLNAQAEMTARCRFFEEDFVVANPFASDVQPNSYSGDETELIHDALILGIRDYFRKSGLKKAILGLSGGIDSAVTLVLAAKALGKDNVMSLLLPSAFSSQHSIDDALALAYNLGTPCEIINIENVFNSSSDTLAAVFAGKAFDITEENLQARIRALLLMAYSNKFGHVLLNTSNKSEAAVGYGTLYGDMCGALSVLGDVYKTQVYALAHYINEKRIIIPENSITKAPSAELRHDQKDSDSLPEYDILDKILFEYIENALTPVQIEALGYEKSLVERIVRLVNMNEFKRFQAPPILRVSPRAFGSGRQIPLNAKF